MFQRILVPLDGSERAARALPVAARLARASHGTLIVVQAIDINMNIYAVPEMMITESVVETESSEVDDYLTQVTAPFKQEGIPIEQIVLFGIPAFLLLSTIISSNIDLVVMCSHGRTGFTHWALGSVTEKIARSSPVPTLILREHDPIISALQHPGRAHPLCILIPLDGSIASKAAIEPAAALISALAVPASGAMHLTRVVQPTENDIVGHYQRNMDDLVQKTRQSLQKTAKNVRDGFEASSVAPLGLNISCSIAIDTDSAQAIIRIAEHGEDAEDDGVFSGCDVIAMATHGRTGIDRLTIGSITERVVHTTRLPILVVPMGHNVVQKVADEKHYRGERSASLPRYEMSETRESARQ